MIAIPHPDDCEPVQVCGSGNIFCDLDLPDAGLEQLRSILAARIIEALDARRLVVHGAQELTGFAAVDFSRTRHTDIDRFAVDRLMTMLARLGEDVEVTDTNRPHNHRAA